MLSVILLPVLNILSGRQFLKSLAICLFSVTLCSCGGGSAETPAPPPGPAAPSGLSYPAPQAYVFTQGAAIAGLQPSVTGTVTSYSLAPALPGGLSLNTTTGVISGTPTAAAPQASYTITASNAGGSVSAAVSITVNLAAPTALSYASPPNFTVGKAPTPLNPTVTGTVQTWTVLPALPAGLTFSATTGVISGMPAATAAPVVYRVTAANTGGITSFDITLAVDAAPPLRQENAYIGECLNMGDHLEAPNEGDWGRPIRDSDFADIHARGFKTIRLPVRFSNHALPTAPYTLDPAFMNRVEHVVDAARAAGLRVILDMHHYNDPPAGIGAPQGNIFSDPDGQAARFAAMWKQIAERFKSKDEMVWFELLHEPQGNLDDAKLPLVLGPALAEVRATNPARAVVIGGQNWSGIDSLATLAMNMPLDDPYLVATFHYYDSFEFTHQGAPWVTPVLPTGRAFPEPQDITEQDADFQLARNFMTASGRPLILGEYGAYQGIPLGYRAAWYKRVHDGFKAEGVHACAWAYTATMQFRDPATDQWIPEMLRAIGLDPP